jgi:ATP synthase protein I
MADRKPPEDDLSNLRRRIDVARGEDGSQNAPPQSAAGLAFRIGGEFGAGVIVGGLLGYGIDYFLGTSPGGLLIGLLLGAAAGIWNMVRTAREYSKAHPVDPNAPSIPDDEED